MRLAGEWAGREQTPGLDGGAGVAGNPERAKKQRTLRNLAAPQGYGLCAQTTRRRTVGAVSLATGPCFPTGNCPSPAEHLPEASQFPAVRDPVPYGPLPEVVLACL